MKVFRKSYWFCLAAMGLLFTGCKQLNHRLQSSTPAASIISGSGGCHKIAFVMRQKTTTDIYSVCPDGSKLTNLTDNLVDDMTPAWSQDGTKIAFASARAGGSQIFVMSADGSHLTQITSDDQNDLPIWLPDGIHIAFRSTDTKGLWRWRLADLNSGWVVQISEPSYDFFYQTPAWSPDGERIAYMSLLEQKDRNDGSSQIHVKDSDGSNDVALTHDIWANIKPVWSPDGTRLAFLSERDGKYNSFALYLMAADGTNVQKLTEPVYSDQVTFSWSPDGQQIVIDSDMPVGYLTIIDTKTGAASQLLNLLAGETVSAPAWQP